MAKTNLCFQLINLSSCILFAFLCLTSFPFIPMFPILISPTMTFVSTVTLVWFVPIPLFLLMMMSPVSLITVARPMMWLVLTTWLVLLTATAATLWRNIMSHFKYTVIYCKIYLTFHTFFFTALYNCIRQSDDCKEEGQMLSNFVLPRKNNKNLINLYLGTLKHSKIQAPAFEHG